MNKLALCIATSMLFAAPAFAKTEPPAQTHHCKMADGSMDMGKTKKACAAAKGTWAKDGAMAAAPMPAASSAAAKPAASAAMKK